MSRKGSCIDNGVTEQVFGRMKDEFFRGRKRPCFEDFKRDLDDCIAHWNKRRRQVKPKGLAPEEFRSQSLRFNPLFIASKFWDAVQMPEAFRVQNDKRSARAHLRSKNSLVR